MVWGVPRRCAVQFGRAIRHGLPESAALAALTEVPARLIGAEDRVGSIAPGLEANLLVTDGPVFHPGCLNCSKTGTKASSMCTLTAMRWM